MRSFINNYQYTEVQLDDVFVKCIREIYMNLKGMFEITNKFTNKVTRADSWIANLDICLMYFKLFEDE